MGISMETYRSDSHCDHSWNDSIKRLHRGLEPEISASVVSKAFAALKVKWQTGDETVDVNNMAMYLNISQEHSKKIIDYYESQHFCTKFKLK